MFRKMRRYSQKISAESAEEVEAEIESAINRVQLICIHIEQITGKTVHEK